MIGKTFGALKIVAFAGRQSSNRCWAYCCLECGVLGYRQGTALKTGRRTSCPACGAQRASKGKSAPTPTTEEIGEYVDNLLRTGLVSEGAIGNASGSRDWIRRLNEERFRALQAKVAIESTRRENRDDA